MIGPLDKTIMIHRPPPHFYLFYLIKFLSTALFLQDAICFKAISNST